MSKKQSQILKAQIQFLQRQLASALNQQKLLKEETKQLNQRILKSTYQSQSSFNNSLLDEDNALKNLNYEQLESIQRQYKQKIQLMIKQHQCFMEAQQKKQLNCQNTLRRYKQLYKQVCLHSESINSNIMLSSYTQQPFQNNPSCQISRIEGKVIEQLKCQNCCQIFKPFHYFEHIETCKNSQQKSYFNFKELLDELA